MGTFQLTQLERREQGAARVLRRPCSLCGESANALGAIPVAGVWVCARCFRREASDVTPDRAPPQVAAVPTELAAAPPAALADPAPAMTPVLQHLHRIDRWHRGVCFAGRLGIYSGLWAWSIHAPTGAAVFSGFLLADALTWLAATLIDVRFHRLAVGLELAFYLACTGLWLSMDSAWTLPQEASLQAAAWLSFGLVMVLKTAWTLQRYTIREP